MSQRPQPHLMEEGRIVDGVGASWWPPLATVVRAVSGLLTSIGAVVFEAIRMDDRPAIEGPTSNVELMYRHEQPAPPLPAPPTAAHESGTVCNSSNVLPSWRTVQTKCVLVHPPGPLFDGVRKPRVKYEIRMFAERREKARQAFQNRMYEFFQKAHREKIEENRKRAQSLSPTTDFGSLSTSANERLLPKWIRKEQHRAKELDRLMALTRDEENGRQDIAPQLEYSVRPVNVKRKRDESQGPTTESDIFSRPAKRRRMFFVGPGSVPLRKHNLTRNHSKNPRRLLETIRQHGAIRQDDTVRRDDDPQYVSRLQPDEDEPMCDIDSLAAAVPSKPIRKSYNYPALTPEQDSVVRNLLGPGPNREIQVKFSIDLKTHDVLTLRPTEWLNDEVINFYGSMIMHRSKSCNGKYPRVHFFNSFFYEFLETDGYNKVKGWSKKVKPSLWDQDLVIFPVHVGLHWCCGVINFKQRSIEYYDSMRGGNPKFFMLVRGYLNEESIKSRGVPFDFTEWRDYAPKHIPFQTNGYDCGVFTCMYAEYLSRNEEFDFEQSDMPAIRRRLVYEVSNASFLVPTAAD
ncbi:hypothetical protein SeMB42_g05747 [Synchytrium endobioticum]|uniref:Ubiquitin-like protease family profile domain-containing protein n=1 Tax=Synchytrium endobioticum TaxID=286115 RepID=A0A507D561_9FUNG|nr:hypothetical protein SeMB42_g05747 [Synchytrium endobioticum]TPX46471.1 hypothetical protein SeLEV6574_g03210 [Synchytrium endobioticum]